MMSPLSSWEPLGRLYSASFTSLVDDKLATITTRAIWAGALRWPILAANPDTPNRYRPQGRDAILSTA